MPVSFDLHGDVAVLTLDNPPVNGLDLATREALAAAIERADDDPAIQAIVLMGAGKTFCGGADIKEFGAPAALREPTLFRLIELVEGASKPVVAAVHGSCVGGGLELSLGCQYRVAAPDTDVALPEVKIGLLPGAGGTQRLPRAIGLEPALAMIVGGEPVPSQRLAALPGQQLFQQIVTGDLREGAVAFARSVAGVRPLPRVRDLPLAHPDAAAYFAAARAGLPAAARRVPAPLRCIDCIEAGFGMPFDDALQRERGAFVALMFTPESRALRHAFFAQRAAGRVPGLPPDTVARGVQRVGIVGAGTMGSGIAIAVLDAGLPVTLVETTQTALDRGLAAIGRHYEAQVGKRRLTPEAATQRLRGLQLATDMDALRPVDLVIEAVFEDLAVKQQVFAQLDAVLRPGAILASNTSTLDLDAIAASTKRPQDVVGLHFFSPAPVMKLLEVVRGAQTAPDVLATALQLAKRLRKTAVVAGVCDGFIGNRMLEQFMRQAGFLLEEGATPQQVDQAIEAFGFAMGPFRVSDLAGNDISWAIRKRRAAEKPQMRYSKTADLLCEMGRFGQKTGAGWYDYAPGRREPVVSEAVVEMIERHRKELGITARPIPDVEIVQRLVYALVNEGARLLEEGIASKAGDIDTVYLTGYGFPAHRGGPMFHADMQGLPEVVQAMAQFARNPHDDAAFWQPAPLLARLAAEGRGFH